LKERGFQIVTFDTEVTDKAQTDKDRSHDHLAGEATTPCREEGHARAII
jgi:hypothetical protein